MKITNKEVHEYVPAIIKIVKKHSRFHPIKSEEIQEILESKGISIQDVTIRKCIKYIQFNGLLHFVVASSCGFYFTRSKREITEQIDSLQSREKAIRTIRKSIERQLNSYIRKK